MFHEMNYITFHCKYGQMSIHRGCILHLGRPTHVQVLVSVTAKELLLKPATACDRDAFLVPATIYRSKPAFGISGQSFLRMIMDMMSWRDDNAYRVAGTKLDGAILFSLDHAQAREDWQEVLITDGAEVDHS